jgi:hypothetical protein
MEQVGFGIERADHGRVRVYADYICVKRTR